MITDRSVDFLEKYAQGDYGKEPFLLKVSYPDPHHPCTPPGKYADMYDPEEMELPASFNDKENLKDHKFLGHRLDRRTLRNMMFRTTNEEEAKIFISHTYGMVSMIDDSVGQILETLEKHDLSDDTIIVYTSDHGDMMGEHGMILKGWLPFQGVLKVPFIIKAPGIARAGSVSDSLVSSVDLAPTILNLCNIEKDTQPPDMQGLDLTPILKDPAERLRDCCYIEIDEVDSGLARALHPKVSKAAARVKYLMTDRYALTVYNDVPGYGDLFDLQDDPDEMNNLWFSNPELRHELVEKLMFEMMNNQSVYPKKQAMT